MVVETYDIELNWDDSPDPDFKRFEVWRSAWLPIAAVNVSAKYFELHNIGVEGWYETGDTVEVVGSTGNDGSYTVDNVVVDGINNTVKVYIDPTETIPSSTADGYLGKSTLDQLASKLTSTRYLDRNMPRGYYYYVVYAVDKYGNYSDPSELVVKYAPADQTGPQTPQNLEVIVGNARDAVQMLWDAPTDENFDEFLVYRTDTANGLQFEAFAFEVATTRRIVHIHGDYVDRIQPGDTITWVGGTNNGTTMIIKKVEKSTFQSNYVGKNTKITFAPGTALADDTTGHLYWGYARYRLIYRGKKSELKDNDIPIGVNWFSKTTDVKYLITAADKYENVSGTVETDIIAISGLRNVRVNIDYLSLNIYWDKPNEDWEGDVVALIKTRKNPDKLPIGAVATNKLSVRGDLTALFPSTTTLIVDGSTYNNGIYTVASSAFVDGYTEITTNEAVDTTVADGYVERTDAYTFAAAQVKDGRMYIEGPLLKDYIYDIKLAITKGYQGSVDTNQNISLADNNTARDYAKFPVGGLVHVYNTAPENLGTYAINTRNFNFGHVIDLIVDGEYYNIFWGYTNALGQGSILLEGELADKFAAGDTITVTDAGPYNGTFTVVGAYNQTGGRKTYQPATVIDLPDTYTEIVVTPPASEGIHYGKLEDDRPFADLEVRIVPLTELYNQPIILSAQIPNYEEDLALPNYVENIRFNHDPENDRCFINWNRMNIDDDILRYEVYVREDRENYGNKNNEPIDIWGSTRKYKLVGQSKDNNFTINNVKDTIANGIFLIVNITTSGLIYTNEIQITGDVTAYFREGDIIEVRGNPSNNNNIAYQIQPGGVAYLSGKTYLDIGVAPATNNSGGYVGFPRELAVKIVAVDRAGNKSAEMYGKTEWRSQEFEGINPWAPTTYFEFPYEHYLPKTISTAITAGPATSGGVPISTKNRWEISCFDAAQRAEQYDEYVFLIDQAASAGVAFPNSQIYPFGVANIHPDDVAAMTSTNKISLYLPTPVAGNEYYWWVFVKDKYGNYYAVAKADITTASP